jgi:hypothetical protein
MYVSLNETACPDLRSLPNTTPGASCQNAEAGECEIIARRARCDRVGSLWGIYVVVRNSQMYRR